MLVGGVVQHELGDHAQPPLVRGGEERREVVHRAVHRVDAVVVGDVVAVVAEGRRKGGQQPQRVDAERFEVIELARQPPEIADAVAVAVEERLDVELIDDGVLVPEWVAGAHVSAPRSARTAIGESRRRAPRSRRRRREWPRRRAAAPRTCPRRCGRRRSRRAARPRRRARHDLARPRCPCPPPVCRTSITLWPSITSSGRPASRCSRSRFERGGLQSRRCPARPGGSARRATPTSPRARAPGARATNSSMRARISGHPLGGHLGALLPRLLRAPGDATGRARPTGRSAASPNQPIHHLARPAARQVHVAGGREHGEQAEQRRVGRRQFGHLAQAHQRAVVVEHQHHARGAGEAPHQPFDLVRARSGVPGRRATRPLPSTRGRGTAAPSRSHGATARAGAARACVRCARPGPSPWRAPCCRPCRSRRRG